LVGWFHDVWFDFVWLSYVKFVEGLKLNIKQIWSEFCDKYFLSRTEQGISTEQGWANYAQTKIQRSVSQLCPDIINNKTLYERLLSYKLQLKYRDRKNSMANLLDSMVFNDAVASIYDW